jgi:hypothetical protein
MANVHNIDPALAAKRDMELAGEDDAAYMAASESLHVAIATTQEGLRAKLDLFNSYFDGSCAVTAEDVRPLLESILDSLPVRMPTLQ